MTTTSPPGASPTYVLGPDKPTNRGLSLGVKLGVVLGIIALAIIALVVVFVFWLRIRSMNRRQRAIAQARRQQSSGRRSTGSERTSRLSHSNIFLPDPALIDSADFSLPVVNGPPMAYHPGESGRTRRVTRALDTDAQGRRDGAHPDDSTGKEELPAYSQPQPGLPSYIDIERLPALPSAESLPRTSVSTPGVDENPCASRHHDPYSPIA